MLNSAKKKIYCEPQDVTLRVCVIFKLLFALLLSNTFKYLQQLDVCY